MDEKLKLKLSKADIDSYLSEINDRLAAEGKTGEIIMGGGAVMTAVYSSRDSTGDVDAWMSHPDDIKAIAADMADLHKLRNDWLNDSINYYLQDGNITTEDYLSFGNLTVKAISAESMLGMKIDAARWDSWDYDDCVTLMKEISVGSIDEVYEAFAKYTYGDKVTSDTRYFVEKAYEKYENEKEKDTDNVDNELEQDEKNTDKIETTFDFDEDDNWGDWVD